MARIWQKITYIYQLSADIECNKLDIIMSGITELRTFGKVLK